MTRADLPKGDLHPGRGLARRGLHPGDLGRPPGNQKSGRYASYWNAFLLI